MAQGMEMKQKLFSTSVIINEQRYRNASSDKGFFGQSRAQKESKECAAVRYIAALCTAGIELKEIHNLASL